MGGDTMENAWPRLGCLVMAAGNARRFGENKLTCALDGRTLIERTLEAVPREEFAAVCSIWPPITFSRISVP